ncbi:hypothetical protein [Micromonospora chersina]|uniref:Secreted protein n=1 Tax=Micromonospora chersina TaxID=47854 RepID=A0A1C6VMV3_9ACTN|nr:hypothetical protein [Micromonospora chersina]SCL67643.1 hypothetical protein GA0070603_4536 [Micromonospora chersina]
MRVLSKAAVVGVTGAAVAATFAGVALAAGDDTPTETNGGSIVEDFKYPGAAAILAEQNVELISGDGHIMLADCDTPVTGDVGLIKVWTTEPIGQTSAGLICFKALASTGRLDLKVPGVYEIRGDGQTSTSGHNGTATVTTDAGVKTTKDLDPNGSTQFGIGEGGEEPTTLLQLTVKP